MHLITLLHIVICWKCTDMIALEKGYAHDITFRFATEMIYYYRGPGRER